MAQKFPTIDAVHEVVDAWFAERVQQPPLSHSVEVYNQAHAAFIDLKRSLYVLITGEEPPIPILELEPAQEQSDPSPETTPVEEPASTQE